jgi:hypothetical protein
MRPGTRPEALIREWPRLREWLNQDRERIWLQRQVDRAADEWEWSGSSMRRSKLAAAERRRADDQPGATGKLRQRAEAPGLQSAIWAAAAPPD